MEPFYWQKTTVDASGLATIIDTVRKYQSGGLEMVFRRDFNPDEGEAEDIMKTLGFIVGRIAREHLDEGQEFLRSCLVVGDSDKEERKRTFVLSGDDLDEISYTYHDSNPSAEIVGKGGFVGVNVWYKGAGEEKCLPLIDIDAEEEGYLVKYDNLQWWGDVKSVTEEQIERAEVLQGELKYAIETALGLEPDFSEPKSD